MAKELPESKRAENLEALAPLVELCRSGRLFDVQEWIAAGNPVNTPSIQKKGTKTRSPLEVAIERGFHSLVKVLLQGGALQVPEGCDCPMNRALRARRFDIVQLLVDHGFDPKSVDMGEVFASWDPEIMSYFVDRGADIRTGNPFARAFCNRILTALRVFKECRERQPEIQEQANIALRYHCKEGNLKWVSLMLWVGADPQKPGTENPDEEPDEVEHGAGAFERKGGRRPAAETVQARKIAQLEARVAQQDAKLTQKNEVISELMEANVREKKRNGEL